MKKPMPKNSAAKAGKKDSSSRTPSKAPSNTLGYDEKKYRTEDAMRTLMRAEELKKDRGLMRDVEAMAKEQAQKLSGLCGKAK